MKKTEKYLILIIVLAFFLRFFKLGINPPSLYWDEVSLGYNAYSILKTGKDEFGKIFPLDKFIAFGDYKPVGYIYATVPSILIFGLNEFSVRLPSTLSGILMVIFTFYLVKKLFDNENLALVSAFLLAISPWSLHLSRAAFEANLAAFFNLLAIFLFIKGVKQKGWWLILSVMSFIVTFYTFNSNRVLTPLLLVALFLIYFRDLLTKKKWILLSIFTGILLILPLLPYLKSRESRLRYYEVNIFSNLEVVIQSNERIALDGGGRLAKLIHHRYLGHLQNFLKHYFDHFSSGFLFINGDVNPRLSVRSVGELYLIELPFFLIGFYYLLSNLKNKNYLMVLLWFLLAPLPAATARETPHALRIVSILPTPQIISALGIYQVLKYIKNKKVTSLFYYLIASLFFINFFYYLYGYYFVFPKKYAGEWLDGYKQAVVYIQHYYDKYDKILITNYYSRPYIYFLFYLKYPPEKYWQTIIRERDWFGNWTVKSFDKFYFGDEPQNLEGKILYVAQPETEISGFTKIGQIDKTNGEIAFWLLER